MAMDGFFGMGRGRSQNEPKLKVNGTLDADLRDIIVVEYNIGDARACEKKEAGRYEEKGAKIKPLGGLGGCSMDWNKGCVLDVIGFRIDTRRCESSA